MNGIQLTNSYNSYPQVQQDFEGSRAVAQKVDNIDAKIEKSALGALPPVRRVMSMDDKVQSGDTFGCLGLASLALVNLPEDIRDVKGAYKQISSRLQGKHYTPKYDHKRFQHHFSFIKGTLIHEYMKNVQSERGQEIVNKIYRADKSLYSTKFGAKVKKWLGITGGDVEETKMKDVFGENVIVSEVKAKSTFGELTGLAMKRATLFGVVALGILELPKIFKAMNQGQTIGEQAGNTAKQTAKSAFNVAAVTTGIAYCGAIGHKYGGAAGSLVGMGVGAVVGATGSKKLQELVS